MHTTASSLVAIVQYFWRIRTSVLYGNQQKFNIEAVNDYRPIRFDIRFELKFPIRRSLGRPSSKIVVMSHQQVGDTQNIMYSKSEHREYSANVLQ